MSIFFFEQTSPYKNHPDFQSFTAERTVVGNIRSRFLLLLSLELLLVTSYRIRKFLTAHVTRFQNADLVRQQINLLAVWCSALGNRATNGFVVAGHHSESTDMNIFI
jgi:hypothetical protein